MFEYGFRHLGSSIRQSAEKPAQAPNREKMLFPGALAAGRRMTPSKVSPVVTKRQSAIISLRAKATIIVLRVPRRSFLLRDFFKPLI